MPETLRRRGLRGVGIAAALAAAVIAGSVHAPTPGYAGELRGERATSAEARALNGQGAALAAAEPNPGPETGAVGAVPGTVPGAASQRGEGDGRGEIPEQPVPAPASESESDAGTAGDDASAQPDHSPDENAAEPPVGPDAGEATPRAPAAGTSGEGSPAARSLAADPAAAQLPGQSDQPAPPSRAKQIIANVHTDTVSAYLDGGKLVLHSKYDSPAGQKGIRIDPAETLFQLADSASSRKRVPDGGQYAFIGASGDQFWLAPQTQDPGLIWPGFSTEDEKLAGQLRGGTVSVRLLGAEGPGRVEVYLQETFGPKRVFSSAESLPAWSMGVPQHTHMNWAFTEPGSYALTFEMEAKIGGATQRAQSTYTFVVGNIDAHRVATTTSFAAEYSEDSDGRVVPGTPVTLTATVDTGDGPDANGAVQFRDVAGGRVLGHAPVDADRSAVFRTAELPPGEHRIVAEFVPKWSSDFAASESQEMRLTVAGDAKQRPTADDTRPVPDAEREQHSPGVGARVTSPAKTVQAGATVAGRVDAAALHGDWVSVWLHTSTPVWLGWVQTSALGNFTATVPPATTAGRYPLVVKNRADALVGWDTVRVTARPDGSGPGGGNGGTTPGGGNGPGGGLPTPEPTAPGQECVPEVVLENGHIDAFNVAVADGQAVLQLKEDVTGLNVIREAESVLLRVAESAYGSVPPGISGAPATGYVLPLSQDANLIWPGWNTLGYTEASGFTNVSVNIVSVDGPGRVFLATQESFGAWKPILTGGFAMPGTIPIPEPAHTHAAWVFSEKGNYRLTVNATATKGATGETLTTATHTYMFQVGDVPLGDAFCGVGVDPAAAEAGRAVGTAVRQAGGKAAAAGQTKHADGAAATGAGARRSGGQARGAGDGLDGALDELLGGGAHPAQIAGVVGGGLLLLSGIVGGTVWFVRRYAAGVP